MLEVIETDFFKDLPNSLSLSCAEDEHAIDGGLPKSSASFCRGALCRARSAASRISAIMRIGAGAGDDPFLKGLITDLIDQALFAWRQSSWRAIAREPSDAMTQFRASESDGRPLQRQSSQSARWCCSLASSAEDPYKCNSVFARRSTKDIYCCLRMRRQWTMHGARLLCLLKAKPSKQTSFRARCTQQDPTIISASALANHVHLHQQPNRVFRGLTNNSQEGLAQA